uniref:Uncharacterized protein n=1 Tax=Cacopsylla melanoneura TaxID=428564 RepID=A0A8D8UF55_9HEMI
MQIAIIKMSYKVRLELSTIVDLTRVHFITCVVIEQIATQKPSPSLHLIFCHLRILLEEILINHPVRSLHRCKVLRIDTVARRQFAVELVVLIVSIRRCQLTVLVVPIVLVV